MRKVQVGRAPRLLSLFVLATPMMMLAIGHGKKKPVKEVVVEEQQESSEVASIINHVIASENLYSVKLMGFSPRIETYVQYYQPDNELGDVAINDDTFLGRLKFDGEGKEVSFVPAATLPIQPG
jgi:thymidylate kinase